MYFHIFTLADTINFSRQSSTNETIILFHIASTSLKDLKSGTQIYIYSIGTMENGLFLRSALQGVEEEEEEKCARVCVPLFLMFLFLEIITIHRRIMLFTTSSFSFPCFLCFNSSFKQQWPLRDKTITKRTILKRDSIIFPRNR